MARRNPGRKQWRPETTAASDRSFRSTGSLPGALAGLSTASARRVLRYPVSAAFLKEVACPPSSIATRQFLLRQPCGLLGVAAPATLFLPTSSGLRPSDALVRETRQGLGAFRDRPGWSLRFSKRPELNRLPTVMQTVALPNELRKPTATCHPSRSMTFCATEYDTPHVFRPASLVDRPFRSRPRFGHFSLACRDRHRSDCAPALACLARTGTLPLGETSFRWST